MRDYHFNKKFYAVILSALIFLASLFTGIVFKVSADTAITVTEVKMNSNIHYGTDGKVDGDYMINIKFSAPITAATTGKTNGTIVSVDDLEGLQNKITLANRTLATWCTLLEGNKDYFSVRTWGDNMLLIYLSSWAVRTWKGISDLDNDFTLSFALANTSKGTLSAATYYYYQDFRLWSDTERTKATVNASVSAENVYFYGEDGTYHNIEITFNEKVVNREDGVASSSEIGALQNIRLNGKTFAEYFNQNSKNTLDFCYMWTANGGKKIIAHFNIAKLIELYGEDFIYEKDYVLEANALQNFYDDGENLVTVNVSPFSITYVRKCGEYYVTSEKPEIDDDPVIKEYYNVQVESVSSIKTQGEVNKDNGLKSVYFMIYFNEAVSYERLLYVECSKEYLYRLVYKGIFKNTRAKALGILENNIGYSVLNYIKIDGKTVKEMLAQETDVNMKERGVSVHYLGDTFNVKAIQISIDTYSKSIISTDTSHTLEIMAGFVTPLNGKVETTQTFSFDPITGWKETTAGKNKEYEALPDSGYESNGEGSGCSGALNGNVPVAVALLGGIAALIILAVRRRKDVK